MKAGVRTSEFWIVVVANVLTQLGALDVPERFRGWVLAASVAGYALSRGIAKVGGELEPAPLADPTDSAGAHDHADAGLA